MLLLDEVWVGVRIELMGDAAWIIRGLPAEPFRYVAALQSIERVTDVAPSYETLGVFFDPHLPPSQEDVLAACSGEPPQFEGRLHEIPVCYELGEDLNRVASDLNLSSIAVVELHTSVEYTCWALGFQPGFPYLGWLPEKLQGVPRLGQPRVRVPEGSVAIADRQTGIYPAETPGGWSILGRTPVRMFADGEFFLSPGDRVRFRAISPEMFRAGLKSAIQDAE